MQRDLCPETNYPHETVIDIMLLPFVFLLLLGFHSQVLNAMPRKRKPKYSRYAEAI